MDDLIKKLHKMIDNHGRGSAVHADDYLSLAEINAILAVLGAAQGGLGKADVWHEGSLSFYHAQLLRKLTPEEALALPPEIEGDAGVGAAQAGEGTPRTDVMVTGNSDPSTEEYEDLAAFTRLLERKNIALRGQLASAKILGLKTASLIDKGIEFVRKAEEAERELTNMRKEREQYLPFYLKWAVSPYPVEPSCFICGCDMRDKPYGVKHLEVAGIVACEDCKNARNKLAEAERKAEQGFRDGAKAMFDYFHERAANNYHGNPKVQESMDAENKTVLEWIGDALESVSPKDSCHWRDLTEEINLRMEAERKLADAADLLGKGPNLLISRAHYQELINRLSERDRNAIKGGR